MHAFCNGRAHSRVTFCCVFRSQVDVESDDEENNSLPLYLATRSLGGPNSADSAGNRRGADDGLGNRVANLARPLNTTGPVGDTGTDGGKGG